MPNIAVLVFSVLGFLAALPASTNLKLNSYSVGSGSTNSASSTTYGLEASTGQVNSATSTSANYQVKSGAIQAQQANVPLAPTLSNGGDTYYDRLNFIINIASNPTDATYSVAVSTTSDFAATNYVQADGTLASTPVYQTYTQWGSGTGTLAIGLNSGTAYWFKVNAIHGKFTASAYGPSANASTISLGPTIGFALSPSNIDMGSLLAGSIVSSPSNISITFATNANNGGTIYMAGQYTGLRSASSSNYTIQTAPPSGDLSSLSEGFGLQNITASSPLISQSPYNGSGNTVGAVYATFQPVFASTSAVSSGVSTAKLMAKSSVSTPSSSDYTNTLTFIAAASY
jgi:hypothetical protein